MITHIFEIEKLYEDEPFEEILMRADDYAESYAKHANEELHSYLLTDGPYDNKYTFKLFMGELSKSSYNDDMEKDDESND